ncbi:hypothetical protein RFI_01572 [Reticulomyxa filosa]|uniref:Uncharacterized protein n=1 Tax=Reticulomyxa filosa TaxID=46433 RepID=X6PCU1_RETFI|nr:hypothetical protein RFI_01572 [Reticulomyxa filosa]|eukprot:ETO35487.1 hypothetical protein RFI_01572 [Reticulomyxa filosa]
MQKIMERARKEFEEETGKNWMMTFCPKQTRSFMLVALQQATLSVMKTYVFFVFKKPTFFENANELISDTCFFFGKTEMMGRKVENIPTSIAEEKEEEEGEIPKEVMEKEIADALKAVRERGKDDRQYLAGLVCDRFYEVNGREAETKDVTTVFGRVQEQLAQEAKEELSDDSQEDEARASQAQVCLFFVIVYNVN